MRFYLFFKVDFSKRELIFFVLQKRIHTPCQAVTCVFILSFSFFSCFLQKRINFSVVFSKRELKLSVVFSKRELIFSVVFSKTELMFSVVFSKRELIPRQFCVCCYLLIFLNYFLQKLINIFCCVPQKKIESFCCVLQKRIDIFCCVLQKRIDTPRQAATCVPHN